MPTDRINELTGYIDARYPQFMRGVDEAIRLAPERFDVIADRYLGWLVATRGPTGIQESVDAFVQFTTDVNLAQARYEQDGHYQYSSFDAVEKIHYSQDAEMRGYLWGIYLTNFLWAHHLEICMFFEDRFLSRLNSATQLIEIAPGHGGWGAWALHRLGNAELRGFDISATSIDIATSLISAAGMADRASYVRKNALALLDLEKHSADAGISSFLVEHLEEPQKLFRVIHHLLRPGGMFFLTGALTAAQIDHIYEMHRESELILMAEECGLRVRETLSTNPSRLFPGARFVPRSMALLIEKPT